MIDLCASEDESNVIDLCASDDEESDDEDDGVQAAAEPVDPDLIIPAADDDTGNIIPAFHPLVALDDDA